MWHSSLLRRTEESPRLLHRICVPSILGPESRIRKPSSRFTTALNSAKRFFLFVGALSASASQPSFRSVGHHISHISYVQGPLYRDVAVMMGRFLPPPFLGIHPPYHKWAKPGTVPTTANHPWGRVFSRPCRITRVARGGRAACLPGWACVCAAAAQTHIHAACFCSKHASTRCRIRKALFSFFFSLHAKRRHAIGEGVGFAVWLDATGCQKGRARKE